MELAVALTQLVLLVAIAAFVVRTGRHRPEKPLRSPQEPRSAPSEGESTTPGSPFVRRADYEADVAAFTRRLTSLETTVDDRHQQLTGLIGSLRRQERGGQKEQLAELLQQQLTERRGAEPSTADAAARRVRVIRRQA